MNNPRAMMLASFGFLAALGAACGSERSAPSAPGPGPASPAMTVDHDALAERLIGESAAVREGELVQIQGTPADHPLMEALAIAVRRRGAFPLLTVTSTELERNMYLRVPEKYDAQPPRFELALADVLSVFIDLVPESDEFHPGVPPERIARIFEGRSGLHLRHHERGIRHITLGNESYPSRARAERYGIPYEKLEHNYWRGLNTDSAVITARAAWMREKLSRSRVVEVTNPNGTHIKMNLAGRKILVNDGVMTAEKMAAGGAAVETWLPAGELLTTPVVGSVNGTIVVDRMLFQDTRVEGLRVELTDGRLTRLTAKAGLDGIKRYYDAGGPGKEQFSALDIGINPNVEYVPEAWLNSSVAAGMILVGVGGNAWAGGENNLSFGILLYVPGSTLLADGEALIADGVLRLPPGMK
jgi:aminopeptidase